MPAQTPSDRPADALPTVLAAAAGPVRRRVRGAFHSRLVPQRWQRAGLHGSGSGLDDLGGRQPVEEPHRWVPDPARRLCVPALRGDDPKRAGNAEATVRGSVQLARVAFAGALTGITGITMAIVMIAAAATEGADADPVVSQSGGRHGGGGAVLRRRDGLRRDARGCRTARRCAPESSPAGPASWH